jgi:hypothetical protein
MDVMINGLGLSLIFTLFIECTALLVDEVGAAIICRLIIYSMVGLVYHLQCQLNDIALTNGKKRIVKPYNIIVFGIMLLSIMLHLIYMRYNVTLYSLVIVFLSFVIIIEEYQQFIWLWKIQISRRKSVRNDDDDDDISGGDKKGYDTLSIQPRTTLYQQIKLLIYDKFSSNLTVSSSSPV